MRSPQLVTCPSGGGAVCLVNDAFIGRGLERYGEWCEHELELLLPLLQPGMTVLDVGANLGSHTIPFARAVGPRGRVLAFEPRAQVFHILAGNIAMNALVNVTPIQAGVGAQMGEAKRRFPCSIRGEQYRSTFA